MTTKKPVPAAVPAAPPTTLPPGTKLLAANQVLPKLYTYWMTVTEVHDGDTVTVDWDLGKDITTKNVKLRLYGLNAPELAVPEQKDAGLRARDFLRAQVLGKRIVVQTVRDSTEKYGRYLGILFVQQADQSFVNVNDLLISNGYAAVYLPK